MPKALVAAQFGPVRAALAAMVVVAVILSTASPVSSLAGGCPPRYTIEVFDGPGNESLIYAAAINANGVIVGDYYSSVLANSKAFKWNGGPDITLIPMPLGTIISSATDIADDGAIVGEFGYSGGGSLGFLRYANATTPIGVPDGAIWAKATGVNSAHVVVGYASDSAGVLNAFRWMNGKFENLTPDTGFPFATASAISEGGLITGDAGNDELLEIPYRYPFIWDRGKVTLLEVPAGALQATGYSITDNRLVCGETYYPDDPPRSGFYTLGTVWTNGIATGVGTLLGDVWSRLYSINATGDAVGVSDNNQVGRPILWHDGTLYNVKELLVDPASVTQLGANAINDAGQIAGVATLSSSGGYFGARLTPVPQKTGDVNCTGAVNIDDLLSVINTWGPCDRGETCGTDLNDDMTVNTEDLMIVLKNWDF